MHVPHRIKEKIADLAKELFYCALAEGDKQQIYFDDIANSFFEISELLNCDVCKNKWTSFKSGIQKLKPILELDVNAAYSKDPAAKSIEEVYISYPGFYAIVMYRLSHILWQLDIPVLPRSISEYAHSITGADIHPGAEIGTSFFIDHATGVVIGETAIIKNNVTVYQGVTLGGIQVDKKLASTKRHPTIEENVTIYANATILGGNIVIGKNSIIGANVWITNSVPENSRVTYQSDIKISSK